AIATALQAAITGYTVSTDGGSLTVSGSPAFSVAFSVKGVAPAGSAIIAGTPVADQVDDIDWLQVAFTLSGPARPGEKWSVKVDGTTYNYTAGDDGRPVTLDGIAAGLASKIPSAY